jgi:O-antigen chain-terminating methyltransferase
MVNSSCELLANARRARLFSPVTMPDNEEDLSVERLAEEIRRALPAGSAPADSRCPATTRALDGADRFLTPSVEPGASLAAFKRVLLRVLRLATRSQGTFNAKLLEGARDLDRGIADLRREVRLLAERQAKTASEVDLLHARVGAAGEPAARPAPGEMVEARLPDGVYARFEEEFRGRPEQMRERQEAYRDYFRGVPGPVLDCGCGRGEFLEVLRDAGIASSGVDASAVAVAQARHRGLDAAHGDLFSALAGASGLGGVSALQVVEHLDPPQVLELLRLAHRALSPGGRLLLETINPDSLYAMRAYRLDPTHRWPVPPPALALLVREAGFSNPDVRFLSPVPASEALEERDENDRKLNRWIFGPQDYALLAERSR